MWSIAKSTGRPLHANLQNMFILPHTIATVVSLRQKYDALLELPEPLPEEHWDFPHLVRDHIERLYPKKQNNTNAKFYAEESDIDQ